MGMTPAESAAKWKANTTKETAGSKEHFIDLSRMLGYPTPTEADPTGDFYAFENRRRTWAPNSAVHQFEE